MASKETFDFISLPWVCQRRFAEICDPKTLKTFASINETTRNLSKRCHFVEDVDIKFGGYPCIYKLKCFCNEDEFCKDIEVMPNNVKAEVLNFITMGNHTKDLTDSHFLQKLPISFNSIKHFYHIGGCIDLKVLKKLIENPELKKLRLNSGIKSECSLEGFIQFIKNLSSSKVLLYKLVIYRRKCLLTFNLDDLIPYGIAMKQQNIIRCFSSLESCITFQKNDHLPPKKRYFNL